MKYSAARLIVGVVLVIVWTLARADASAADARVALVVGNAAYKSAPLKNPVNDARAIARALKEVGFEVDLQANLSQQGFVTALRNFGKRLNETGGTGLFYYAGHGMQIQGANYLIPIDAGIESEDEIKYMAINANQVLDKMDSAGNRLNIVILDACRDNPFVRSFRSKQFGLAQMDAPSGMLIAFATAPGAVAYDGDGVNGVYTKYLLRNLGIPGLPVELVLKRVREGVSKETASKQIPWESSSLLGDFYFTGDAASAPTATAGTVAIELAFWNSVKDSGAVGEYAAYLNQFPQGRFVELAESRLNTAKSREPVVAATTAQPEQIALTEPSSPSASKPREITTSGATTPAREQTARPIAPTPALPPGATSTDCPDCPEMVVVRAGRVVELADARPNTAKSRKPVVAAATAQPEQIALAEPSSRRVARRRFRLNSGDSWTYVATHRGKRQVQPVTVTVIKVTVSAWDGELIQERITHAGERSFTVERTFRPGFQPRFGLQDSEMPGKARMVEFSPYVMPSDIPASRTQWPDIETSTTSGDSPSNSAMRLSVHVLGKERVKLPAGNFVATKVELRGKVDGSTADIVLTYWYSAEVRRAVKISRAILGTHEEDVYELLGFQQSR